MAVPYLSGVVFTPTSSVLSALHLLHIPPSLHCILSPDGFGAVAVASALSFVTARTALLLFCCPTSLFCTKSSCFRRSCGCIQLRDATCGAEQRWEGSNKSVLAACREDTAKKCIFEVRFFSHFTLNLKFKAHRTFKSYLNACKDR